MSGRGRGRRNLHHGTARDRVNVGFLVSQVSTTITSTFNQLPPWARQELLANLARSCNMELRVADSNNAGVASQGQTGAAPSSTDTNVSVPTPKVWDRPIIMELEAAVRQKGRSKVERNSAAGLSDAKTLSAACAALMRSKGHGISEAMVLSELKRVEGGDGSITLSDLWPRQAVNQPARLQIGGPPADAPAGIPTGVAADGTHNAGGSTNVHAQLLGSAPGGNPPGGDASNQVGEQKSASDGNPSEADPAITYGSDGMVTYVTTSKISTDVFKGSDPILYELNSRTKKDILPDTGALFCGGAESVMDAVTNYVEGVRGSYHILRTYARGRRSDHSLVFLFPTDSVISPPSKKRRVGDTP